MNRFARTPRARVILVLLLCALFRFAVLGLDNLDCRGPGFRQIPFSCDLKLFVLPVLVLAVVLTAVIPSFTLAARRDRIAAFATILLIPAVVNALLRVLDYRRFECAGDGYYTNESICVALYVQLLCLSLPTLAAIIFVSAKGWRLLLFPDSR